MDEKNNVEEARRYLEQRLERIPLASSIADLSMDEKGKTIQFADGQSMQMPFTRDRYQEIVDALVKEYGIENPDEVFPGELADLRGRVEEGRTAQEIDSADLPGVSEKERDELGR